MSALQSADEYCRSLEPAVFSQTAATAESLFYLETPSLDLTDNGILSRDSDTALATAVRVATYLR